MTLSDSPCFVLVLLRCRYSLHNALRKNKENEIKMDHLVRSGEYCLPFTSGYIMSISWAVLVTSMSTC